MVKYDHNSLIVASGGSDRKIIIWDENGLKLREIPRDVHLSDVRCVAFITLKAVGLVLISGAEEGLKMWILSNPEKTTVSIIHVNRWIDKCHW